MNKRGMTLTAVIALLLLLTLLVIIITGPGNVLNLLAKGAGAIADKVSLSFMRNSEKTVLESDKSIDGTYERILSIFRNEGNGPCIFRYQPFSKEIANFKVHLSKSDQGILVELENKDGHIVRSNTISGKLPCVVGEGSAAKNFYKNYLEGASCKENCLKGDYSVAEIVIGDTRTLTGTPLIYVNGEKRSLNDGNLVFKASDGNICFFPTMAFGNSLGCDAGVEGLDDDCMGKVAKLPDCKDYEWQRNLEEYRKNKCQVNKFTCKAEKLPCPCFSSGGMSNKEKPEICSDKQPYCYDGEYGCDDKGPDYGKNLEVCRKSLGDEFQLAPKCEVDKNTCEVKNAPCGCDTAGSKSDPTGSSLPYVCSQNEYCYDGQTGCSIKVPDIIEFFNYCNKSNPNFKLEEIPVCNVNSKCQALNMPCKCELASGQFDICLQNGNSYCHEKSSGCEARAC